MFEKKCARESLSIEVQFSTICFQISKLIFDTMLWASGALSHLGSYVSLWDNAPQAHSRVSNINFDI
jgi:hypothetical protein